MQRWNIPAGPLDAALEQMARQGGLNLSYDAASLQGKTTAGVSGSHENAQALALLLQGSGVQVQQKSANSFLLLPAVDIGDALELGATSISSDRLGETTEHSGSYTTGAVTIGKMPQTLRHTPQSVSVLTRQRLDDQNITNLTTLMEQTRVWWSTTSTASASPTTRAATRSTPSSMTAPPWCKAVAAARSSRVTRRSSTAPRSCAAPPACCAARATLGHRQPGAQAPYPGLPGLGQRHCRLLGCAALRGRPVGRVDRQRRDPRPHDRRAR
ncbi:TonB-dependent receptor [Pseudomonas qingdaonensis]|nr:TonB-dependent receptor [Pseudomonas qingdaonensis]